MIAKSLNHGITFPDDSVGKRVVVFGIVRAEEAGGGEGDGCPQPSILVEILGARLY